MRTGKDDPLLAYWQYGLGTSMAFTSDAQPNGRDYGWAGAISTASGRRPSEAHCAITQHNLQISSRRDGSKGVINIQATTSGNSDQ